MRQAGRVVGNDILIEIDRARNVAGGIFLRAIAVLRGQIPRGVNDPEFRCAKLFLDPISIDDEAALVSSHSYIPLRGIPGRTESDSEPAVFLTLFLDLRDMNCADFLRFGHMRATAWLAVDG